MPQQITPAAGGWQATVLGPADGDTIDAASVNDPMGQIVANQAALRASALGNWVSLAFAASNGGASVQKRAVYGGSDFKQALTSSAPMWAILQSVYSSSTVSAYYCHSGTEPAGGTLLTWTSPAGATPLGYISLNRSGGNVGLMSLDMTAGKGVTTIEPGYSWYAGSFGAALSGVVATYVFPGDSDVPEALVACANGSIIESSAGMTTWTSQAGAGAWSGIGCGKGGGYYAVTTASTVYYGTTLSDLAGQTHTSTPLGTGSIRGMTYDRHWAKWVAWNDAGGTTQGLCVADTPAGPWTAVGAYGTELYGVKVRHFGTDQAGTWIIVTHQTLHNTTLGVVFISCDGGQNWLKAGALEDDFNAPAGSTEIGYGDRRFCVVGNNRVWFSGRIA
jgi:hypothetical protein